MEISSATRPKTTEQPKPIEKPRPVEVNKEQSAQAQAAVRAREGRPPEQKPQPYVNTRGETTGQRVNTTA